MPIRAVERFELPDGYLVDLVYTGAGVWCDQVEQHCLCCLRNICRVLKSYHVHHRLQMCSIRTPQ